MSERERETERRFGDDQYIDVILGPNWENPVSHQFSTSSLCFSPNTSSGNVDAAKVKKDPPPPCCCAR